ncbi:ribosomal protection-like ABC-F family protein [Marinactinospora thermotolerans]|uniref:ATPase components of ABC transporters with duplicated ATPase domains n=2 Tax=Marinactinospora thermotolerans TaxID=531310 RepID=A0A1T4T505_9ACTN|nr:ABC-F family ATP-binding cassette domain-containing protein [Marinactinospora thermotolerans]AET51851.1 ABC transporter [Marinactinospora thermotolerans]SKA35238.1 ATPase components of ABC transporters with duplicated ATPase domains [Marinactinospora thermotolerans DSM 45154]
MNGGGPVPLNDARHSTVVVEGVSKSFGPRTVLSGVSFTAGPGQRVGVVGRNGVGKTTLLRIVAGLETPDEGSVRRHPPESNVGYLPQEITPVPGETLRGYLTRSTGVAGAERELQRLAAGLADDPGLADAYATQLDRTMALGAGDFDARAAATVERVGLGADALDQEMSGMSGGQLARAALTAILLSRFDLLLLDEPTNNLDFAGLELLERFIEEVRTGIIVVSHDRVFLERTVTHVLEIDHGSHEAVLYSGGWAAYRTEQHEARQRQYEKHDLYVSERKRIEAMIHRKREWARKGAARAKSRAPDNNKAARRGRQEGAENLAGGNRALERRLERLEAVEEPYKGWELRFGFGESERSGEVVAQMRGVVVERGRYRLGPIDLDLRWRDRVGLVGPNGSGKSTLVSLLLGWITPTAGEVTLGSNVHIGRLDQHRALLEGKERLFDGVQSITGLDQEQTRSLLAKFDLGAMMAERSFGSLSPGERTRAELALLMHEQVNFLVLDEPTNHLDLVAIEQLEQALPMFGGTLLLVTHDRRLLDRTRLNRYLLLEEEREGPLRRARIRESFTHAAD